MSDPLKSARRKLARAKHHIQDLEREIKAFPNTKPYDVFVEPDPDVPHKKLHRLKLMPLPEFFSDIAADAVNNLRSALDHAAYGIAFASGNTRLKHTAFPIGGSLAEWERSAPGRSKDVPQDIFAFFRALKPYKGGNDLLWGLNEICVRDKHIKLVPVGVGVGGANWNAALDPRVSYTEPVSDRSKNEITFSSIEPEGSQFHYKFNFFLNVEFSEIQLFVRQPAVAVLNNLASEVESVLLGIEAESRRLKIIV